MMVLGPLLALFRERFGLVSHSSEALRRAVVLLSEEFRIDEAELIATALTNPVVLRSLAAAVTIDESHFFRHAAHFYCLADHVAMRLATTAEHVFLWSAGCSRGQEPYSIAMALQERFGQVAQTRITIFASDLNSEVIEAAVRAEYPAWYARGLPARYIGRYAEQCSSGTILIHEAIRAMVRFSVQSVQEHLATLLPGSLDAVVFRNVAIYLDKNALQSLYARMSIVLRSDGLLFIAPTDPCPERRAFRPADDATFSVCRPEIPAAAALPDVARCDGPIAPLEDPDDPVTRYGRALELSRWGAPRRALFHWNRLIEQLRTLPPDEVLSGGTRAGALLVLALEERGQIR